MFALIDAQYLRLERSFRRHFEELRMQEWSIVPTFDMKPSAKTDYKSALLSWSIALFYGALSVAALCITATMGFAHGRFF